MRISILIITSFLLYGCDYITQPGKDAEEKKMAVAKAVGSGCKQGGRSVEDCFSLNPKVSKDGILLGWKEMDSYMRENNLKEQPPQIKDEQPNKKDEIITEKAN